MLPIVPTMTGIFSTFAVLMMPTVACLDAGTNPTVELHAERQPNAAEQVTTEHVAGPMRTVIDASHPDEEDRHGEQADQQRPQQAGTSERSTNER